MSLSVTDHGKCGIKSKLSTLGVHSCVVLVVSVVAMGMGAKDKSKIKSVHGNFI